MSQIAVAMEAHDQRLQEARHRFFARGEVPAGLIEPTIIQSWERCHRGGLAEHLGEAGEAVATQAALRDALEQNRVLLMHAQSIMEHVFEQIRHSGSMVVLADADGMLLQCVGDAEFVDRAHRVALLPGASWEESCRGTNAIGTALIEEAPVEVFGGEHFLSLNGFLTCSAAPLTDSQGSLVGVLDISGDYRAYQRHTLGLVRMSAQIIEKRLFESRHGRDLLVYFHPRAEYLGSLGEGLLAVSPDGRVLGVNRHGLELLGLRRGEVLGRDFSMIFDTPLGTLADRCRADALSCAKATGLCGKPFFVKLGGDQTGHSTIGRLIGSTAPARPTRSRLACQAEEDRLTLDGLCTGDARLRMAIDRARKVLGRDIPILIQGESGAGKEMFARAYHNSGPRGEGPFIALNCAAIPETLIESELFGYLGGAFTGARKEGAMGKIQQAHGGTLFLDEIGDMPLNLQARLLRVLQERSVTPLGSGKAVAVDISLVCATHRRLKEEVAQGNFREDLYYRLNGLSVALPALRERTDLRELVRKLVRAEAGGAEVGVGEPAMEVLERYSWPGNIRQLNNVLRVAIALLDEGERIIDIHHLPEELVDEMPVPAAPARDSSAAAPVASMAPMAPAAGRLEEIEQQAIQRALDAAGGNISAAARKLGISRNTLYRKLGRL